MHLESSFYEDISYATRPKGIPRKDLKKGEFSNVVGVLVCVEKGDSIEYIEQAVERVDVMNKEFYNEGHIFVMPFAHLSNNLERPKKAISILDIFVEMLKEKGYDVSLGSFGTNKKFMISIYGHTGSVSYFEFPYKKDFIKWI